MSSSCSSFQKIYHSSLIFIGLGAVYYFFMKKKPEDTTPSFNYTIQPTQAPTSSTSSGPKGFMDKMKHLNRRMVVFYGSQTGTGEEFAGRLAKEGFKKIFILTICSICISQKNTPVKSYCLRFEIWI